MIMNNWFGKCAKKNLLKYDVNDMIIIEFFRVKFKTGRICFAYLKIF